jgi:hypothetical protein
VDKDAPEFMLFAPCLPDRILRNKRFLAGFLLTAAVPIPFVATLLATECAGVTGAALFPARGSDRGGDAGGVEGILPSVLEC